MPALGLTTGLAGTGITCGRHIENFLAIGKQDEPGPNGAIQCALEASKVLGLAARIKPIQRRLIEEFA